MLLAAVSNNIWIIGGSIPEVDDGKVFNTWYVVAVVVVVAVKFELYVIYDFYILLNIILFGN